MTTLLAGPPLEVFACPSGMILALQMLFCAHFLTRVIFQSGLGECSLQMESADWNVNSPTDSNPGPPCDSPQHEACRF